MDNYGIPLNQAFEYHPQFSAQVKKYEDECLLFEKFIEDIAKSVESFGSAFEKLSVVSRDLSEKARLFQKFQSKVSNNFEPFQKCQKSMGKLASLLEETEVLQRNVNSSLLEGVIEPLYHLQYSDYAELSQLKDNFCVAETELQEALTEYAKFPPKKQNDEQARALNSSLLFEVRSSWYDKSLKYFNKLSLMPLKVNTIMMNSCSGIINTLSRYSNLTAALISQSSLESSSENQLKENTNILSKFKSTNSNLIATLQIQSSELFYPEPIADMPEIPPDPHLFTKSSYVWLRVKTSPFTSRWDRTFIKTLNNCLFLHDLDTFQLKILCKLDDPKITFDAIDIDDRRYTFKISKAPQPASGSNENSKLFDANLLKSGVNLIFSTLSNENQQSPIILQTENEREKQEWLITLKNIQGKLVSATSAPTANRTLKQKNTAQHRHSSPDDSSGSNELESGAEDDNSASGGKPGSSSDIPAKFRFDPTWCGDDLPTDGADLLTNVFQNDEFNFLGWTKITMADSTQPNLDTLISKTSTSNAFSCGMREILTERVINDIFTSFKTCLSISTIAASKDDGSGEGTDIVFTFQIDSRNQAELQTLLLLFESLESEGTALKIQQVLKNSTTSDEVATG